MFGYQGWFGTDNDGLPGLFSERLVESSHAAQIGYGYRHWSQDGGQPRPSSRKNFFAFSQSFFLRENSSGFRFVAFNRRISTGMSS